MTHTLFLYWRIVATGFSFAVLGLGGALLGAALVILLFPLPLSLKRKYQTIRYLLHLAFRLYIACLRLLGLLTWEGHQLDKLQAGGQLIIANHPSLLDVVFLISFVKQANCVVKQGVKENKFTLIPTHIAGYVSNASSAMLQDCCASLKNGDNVILFPEGTRSTPGQSPSFLRGAANIALASNTPLTPVLIGCNPPTLIKGQKWYEVPDSPPHFSFQVMDEIPLEPYRNMPQSKAARALTRDIEQRYHQWLETNNQHIS